MPRQISHQKRYANAVRVITKRGKVSWRTAQKVYRSERVKTPHVKFPSHWKALTAKTIVELRNEATSKLYDAIGKDRPFAFDLKDRPEAQGINAALADSGLARIETLTVEHTIIVDGEKKRVTKTLNDVRIKGDDFWRAVHAAAREALEDEIAEGAEYDMISVVIDSIAGV